MRRLSVRSVRMRLRRNLFLLFVQRLKRHLCPAARRFVASLRRLALVAEVHAAANIRRFPILVYKMKFSTRGIAFISTLFLCVACSGLSENSRPPKPTLNQESERTGNAILKKATNNSFTLSEKKLLNVIDEQDRFIEDFKRRNRLSETDLKTRLAAIENLWRDYFAENPKDVNALIIYGKFLRFARATGKSYETFKKAAALSPDTAVIRQQLSSCETEIGDYANALENIQRACALESNVATYHFQLGEFIYVAADEIIKQKIISEREADDIMLSAFAQAAKLEPDNKNYAVRYAQAFFDVDEANWSDALAAIDKALEFKSLILERDDMLTKKVHALSELGRADEAKKALDQIKRREDLIKSKNKPNDN